VPRWRLIWATFSGVLAGAISAIYRIADNGEWSWWRYLIIFVTAFIVGIIVAILLNFHTKKAE
jgi:phosphotransferase system  glucose/maltose/N-acetylglucosamine-specific IIC component